MIRNIRSPFDRTSAINQYGLTSTSIGVKLNLGYDDRTIGERNLGVKDIIIVSKNERFNLAILPLIKLNVN